MQSGFFQRGGVCSLIYGALGVLHHLEEVMSLPPSLSPPSPAGM